MLKHLRINQKGASALVNSLFFQNEYCMFYTQIYFSAEFRLNLAGLFV